MAKRKDPAADRAVRFINNLTHTKGKFAREPFNLRKWQEQIVRELFKTNPRTGLRQYRTGLLMLPRKNGKSELAAAIALYGLLADGEVGAEVYSAAGDRDQASLVFNVAAEMVRNDPELNAACDILDSTKRIVYRKTGSVYRAISSEAYTKHGFNASMVIADELHVWPNRELWDVLRTSVGARTQPLVFAISTAGYDRTSLLWELYSHACKVRDGVVEDPTFYQCIYEMPKDADWTDEREWKKCNPALGDFRSFEEMRESAARAKSIPAEENAFRRLYGNQWTEQADRWMPMDLWDACHSAIPRASLRGRPCFVGMDLSTTRDLTVIVAVFPDDDGGFDVLPCFFIPKDNIRERVQRDRVPYDQWEREGCVVATEGDVVDYAYVRRTLNQWADEFDLREIAYDPYNATQLVVELSNTDGLPVYRFQPKGIEMTAATKALTKAIQGGDLRHDGHPVLRWCISNATVIQDGEGNFRLSKKVATERMDGAVALAMAVERMGHQPELSSSTSVEAWA